MDDRIYWDWGEVGDGHSDSAELATTTISSSSSSSALDDSLTFSIVMHAKKGRLTLVSDAYDSNIGKN